MKCRVERENDDRDTERGEITIGKCARVWREGEGWGEEGALTRRQLPADVFVQDVGRRALAAKAQPSVEGSLEVHDDVSFERHRHPGALDERHAVSTRAQNNLLHAFALPVHVETESGWKSVNYSLTM